MPPHDLEQTRAQIERFRREWADEGFSHWAAEEPATGRLVGRIGLLRHRDWPLAEAPVEVGWSLHPEFWGRGLATEGGRAAVEAWRDQLTDDPQLISITLPANVRSRRVMEKLGLSYRGTADWHNYAVVWYAIHR
jgi:RimJ/RimL family protein N-acetyltransferase